MNNVIGQKWKVYDFNNVKRVIPKKGELICIENTPDFDNQVIDLMGNGDANVEELYKTWMSDEEPKENSKKAVKSGGVFTWFGGLLSTLKTTAKNIIGAINELFDNTVKTTGNQDIKGVKSFVDGTIKVGNSNVNPTIPGSIDLMDGSMIRRMLSDTIIPFAGTQIDFQGGGLRIGLTDARFFHPNGTSHNIRLGGIAAPNLSNDAATKGYVDSKIPLALTPWLWLPKDGSEIDLGDGSFGRRLSLMTPAGSATQLVITLGANIFTGSSPFEFVSKIISSGGSWVHSSNVCRLGESLFDTGSFALRSTSRIYVSQTGPSMFSIMVQLLAPSNGIGTVPYDFWVRYTK